MIVLRAYLISFITCAGLLLHVSSAGTAYAQQPVTSMDTVVVTATRSATRSFDVPGMASKIEGDAAGTAGASSVSDMLKQVPGLEFAGSARRNGQTPTLRGYDSSGVLVLFDGVRQNFSSGHDGKFYIDPSLLKSVEVMRGSNSTLYGNAALGGTIAFETMQAEDMLNPGESLGGSITTGADSVNDEWHSSASAFGAEAGWDMLATLSYRNGNNYRLGDGSTLQADDAVRSGLIKAGYNGLEHHAFGVEMLMYDATAIEPNNPQARGGEGVDKDISSITTRLTDHYTREDFSLKTQLYHTDTGVDETIIDPTATNQAGDVLTREMTTLGGNIDFQNIWDNHTLSYGAEHYQDDQYGSDSRNGRRGGVPRAEDSFYGIYLQDEFTLEKLAIGKISLIPGLRYDDYQSSSADGFSNSEQALSPRLAASWKPYQQLMLFGNVGEAFRAPTLTEIYASGRHFTVGSFVNNFAANPALKPETNRTAEFGFGVKDKDIAEAGDRIEFKASRFFTSAEDFIDTEVSGSNITGACFSPTPPPGCSGGVTRSVNVAAARLWGYEMEGRYMNGGFTLALGASYVTGKNKNTGAYLTNITPLKLTSNLSYFLSEVSTTLGWKAAYSSEHDDVNSVAAQRPAYTVHDVYLSWTPQDYPDLTIDAGIDNIFDTTYSRVFAGSLEPGRNLKAQVSIRW